MMTSLRRLADEAVSRGPYGRRYESRGRNARPFGISSRLYREVERHGRNIFGAESASEVRHPEGRPDGLRRQPRNRSACTTARVARIPSAFGAAEPLALCRRAPSGLAARIPGHFSRHRRRWPVGVGRLGIWVGCAHQLGYGRCPDQGERGSLFRVPGPGSGGLDRVRFAPQNPARSGSGFPRNGTRRRHAARAHDRHRLGHRSGPSCGSGQCFVAVSRPVRRPDRYRLHCGGAGRLCVRQAGPMVRCHAGSRSLAPASAASR